MTLSNNDFKIFEKRSTLRSTVRSVLENKSDVKLCWPPHLLFSGHCIILERQKLCHDIYELSPLFTAPDPPTGLRVRTKTYTSVTLEWQAPQNTGGTLTGYWVCHSGRTYLDLPSSAFTCTRTTISSSDVIYSVTGLTAGMIDMYSFQSLLYFVITLLSQILLCVIRAHLLLPCTELGSD